ncbi:MAG: FlaA1/EpsC-like NDP-sugar epimerase, partial [Pseudoalteromonas distincta]
MRICGGLFCYLYLNRHFKECHMQTSQKILIIGNGMVGHHFVEQMRQSDANADITVLCGEANLAYDRV